MEGGGATTPDAPEASARGPIPKPARKPCPGNCGGGATTCPAAPRLPMPRPDAWIDGGGSTTRVPGPCRLRRPPIAARSAGGGATAESKPFSPACARAVADSGTDGIAGFDGPRLGVRGPSASFKSGGVTNFGAPCCSAATGIALDPCARAAVCGLPWDWGLVFGTALLRSEE